MNVQINPKIYADYFREIPRYEKLRQDPPKADIVVSKKGAVDSRIIEEIKELFGQKAEEALKVAKCENFNMDTSVISKTFDIGLFQINLSAHRKEVPGDNRNDKIAWLQNSYNNIVFAKILFDRNHWGDWYMSYSCHKLK